MPKIKVDLTSIPSYDLIPDNEYTFEIDRCTKNVEKNYLTWDLVVLDAGDYLDCRIRHITSLKPEALWNLKALVQAAEVEFDEDGFDSDDLIGEHLSSQTEKKEFEGEESSKAIPSSFKPAK